MPDEDCVVDYFMWRQADANRNALNSHCYWTLRKEGATVKEATEAISGKSVSEKNERLFSRGINYSDLPKWQKRGVGVSFDSIEKKGFDPIKQETITVTRMKLLPNYELPINDEYAAYIRSML